jgi:hypothetical protein
MCRIGGGMSASGGPPKPQFRLDETGGIGYSYFNG